MKEKNGPDLFNKVLSAADRDLIQSLNSAAALIQNSVGSQEQVLRAFKQQVQKLGMRGGIALLDATNKNLVFASVAYPKGPIQDTLTTIAGIVGVSIEGFSISTGKTEIHRRVIEEKGSLFVANPHSIIEQLLPLKARPFLSRLLSTLGTVPGIYCPLIVSGAVIGILNITGQGLSERNIPEITAFANHISIALDNARLIDTLRKSELWFKALIENAFDGVTVVDSKGKVLYESPRLKRLLGYDAGERLGIVAFDMVHPDDIAGVQEALGRSVAHPGETLQMVLRVRHKDGMWLWMECSGRNLLDDPNINGIVVNYRDITERKKTEEDRLKLEQQLQQAQKLESLGVLAGGIAHDFNNLLSGLFGYIELANTESKDSTVSGYLATALNTIDRARGLTRQLLTFAKGGAPVRKVGALFPIIRETSQFALSGSNVSCRFNVPAGLLLCNFDKNQIAQVIDNIVINAQQAMPMGGTIEISAMNISLRENELSSLPAGNYVKISIKDNGIGIPKEILPRVFDPFFTTKQKGSGLGLTICYSIIKKHNGCIDVESEQGKGSTFHLFLPASNESPAITAPEPFAGHRGSGRILIMDDEEIIREALGKLLKNLGYSVECRKEGKETLDFFIEETKAGRPFAAMFLDLTIAGGMGGREAVAELRTLNARLPVFVSSGYADDPVMANPGNFGFTDSICKPFKMEELAALLNRHLGDKY